MKHQIIAKDGVPEYAVIPFAEFQQLLADSEMLQDIAAFDSAKKAVESGAEELIPASVVDRLLDGENPVRVWREYRGHKASELARGCGISSAAISQIESGKRKSSVALLRKIAIFLRVDLADLVASDSQSDH